MATLLLRLAGPMQSWGTQSRFTERDTGREPTKSGVVGLLSAALGWERDHDLERLRRLRMGIRVDRDGKVMRDYHITQKVIKAGSNKTDTVVSNRYYLADADFLVGLESNERDFLLKLADALNNPCFPLFLGRKAFPPGKPILPTADELGFGNPTRKKLETALKEALYHPRDGKEKPPDKLRVVIELSPDDDKYLSYGLVRTDQPLSFAERTFRQRRVIGEYCRPKMERR